MSENYTTDNAEQIVRALFGSLFIICLMLSCVACVYKYAQCQEKNRVSLNQNIPRTYTNLEAPKNSPVIIL